MKKIQPKKPIVKFVHCELFCVDFSFIICNLPDFMPEAKKMLVKNKYAELERMVNRINFSKEETVIARQFPLSGGGSIMWAKPEAKMWNLVHELAHAVNYLLCSSRGTPLSEDTDEVYAYLLQFLFKNLIAK